MNIGELRDKLEQLHVDPRAYAIGDCMGRFEACCLEESHGQWLVYYSERGLRTSLRVFDRESKACDYFYQWIVCDPTTRRVPGAGEVAGDR